MKSFTKTITTKFTPTKIYIDFFVYSNEYISAKKRLGKSKGNKCVKCSHEFEINEKISHGMFGQKGAQVLCRKCADELSE